MLKVAHTLDVRSFHAAELALPGVERGTADTVLTTYVLGSPARFARHSGIVMIWCSENRDFFMAPSWGWFTRSLQFGLHYLREGYTALLTGKKRTGQKTGIFHPEQ